MKTLILFATLTLPLSLQALPGNAGGAPANGIHISCEVALTGQAIDSAHQVLREHIFDRPFLYNISSSDAKPAAFERLGLSSLSSVNTRALILFVNPGKERESLKLTLGILRASGWQKLKTPDAASEANKMVLWLSERSLSREFLERHARDMDFVYTAVREEGQVRPYISFDQDGVMEGTHVIMGLNIPCAIWELYSTSPVQEALHVRTQTGDFCRLPLMFFSAPATMDDSTLFDDSGGNGPADAADWL